MIQEDTIVHHDESTNVPVATNRQDQNMNSNEVQNGSTFNGNNNGINDPIDTDSYVEIWAIESDRSDYEYESEFNLTHQLASIQNRQWIDNNISDYMTQIIIMLLRCTYVHMLTIFRDITLEQITTNN
jgi:hypothetical protein